VNRHGGNKRKFRRPARRATGPQKKRAHEIAARRVPDTAAPPTPGGLSFGGDPEWPGRIALAETARLFIGAVDFDEGPMTYA